MLGNISKLKSIYKRNIPNELTPEDLNTILFYSVNSTMKDPNIIKEDQIFLIENGSYLYDLDYSVYPSEYKRNIKSIIIPPSIINITPLSFEYSGIKKVSFPPKVEIIGEYSFQYNMSLTSITFEDREIDDIPKLAIYNRAFSHSGIKRLFIRTFITNIDIGAFEKNDELSSIIFEDRGSYNGRYDNISSLQNIKLGPGAFYSCNLITLILPPFISNIGKLAFGRNGLLTHVVIGEPFLTDEHKERIFGDNWDNIKYENYINFINWNNRKHFAIFKVTLSKYFEKKKLASKGAINTKFSERVINANIFARHIATFI
jgi:hypothetical protein